MDDDEEEREEEEEEDVDDVASAGKIFVLIFLLFLDDRESNDGNWKSVTTNYSIWVSIREWIPHIEYSSFQQSLPHVTQGVESGLGYWISHEKVKKSLYNIGPTLATATDDTSQQIRSDSNQFKLS